jgi:ATP synthase protein I
MALSHRYDADEAEELEFKPLTKQEAQALRLRDPAVSPWWIVGAASVWRAWSSLWLPGVSLGEAVVAWSAAYGACGDNPGGVVCAGLMSQFSSINAATASFGFFLWEAVKMAVSIAMVAARRAD